jgi:hypothetical protein
MLNVRSIPVIEDEDENLLNNFTAYVSVQRTITTALSMRSTNPLSKVLPSFCK